MSQEQAEYRTESKAAIIERPRKVHAIGDKGLEDYQVYGWVKMSAKFVSHIKRLRGAKLSIWLCLALNIDEDGECKLSQKEICEMTGYSHTEVIDSVNELDEMGFLSVDRSGKKNLYAPVFVSKGKGNSPSKETLVKKLDSTPLDSLESSPPLENSVPTSIKKKKDLIDGILFYGQQAKDRKEDKLEELIQEMERGLRVNISRTTANQAAARRILNDGRSFGQWLTWCISDEWRAAHLYLYADLDKVWRDYPQAFDNQTGMNPQGLSLS